MRATQSTRETPAPQRSRRRQHPLSVFAVVDGDKIPPRCFGEPVCIAASDGGSAKAFDALCRMLRRNRQVGITAVALDGATRLAALLPIGNALAVSLLQPDYQRALTDGLRPAA